ncbi:MAG: hypothetical protein F6K00_24425 [Leptolyngbya sp. SIOISBB]|nr:hypothetical protein [Leptolyngbya sp. SIOISBB]
MLRLLQAVCEEPTSKTIDLADKTAYQSTSLTASWGCSVKYGKVVTE